MKKLIPLIVILFTLITTTQAQIVEASSDMTKFKVGKFKNGFETGAEITGVISGADTVYILLFKNAKYSTLKDYKTVSFNAEDGTLNSLYNILKSFFSDENKKNKDYIRQFKLGNEDITCLNYRMLGTTAIYFSAKNGFVYITESQLDKLFGK